MLISFSRVLSRSNSSQFAHRYFPLGKTLIFSLLLYFEHTANSLFSLFVSYMTAISSTQKPEGTKRLITNCNNGNINITFTKN